jgi:hypothetical protein
MKCFNSFSELYNASNTAVGFESARGKTETFRRALPKSGEKRMSGTLVRRIQSAFAELTDGTIPDIETQKNLWQSYIDALETYEASDNNAKDLLRAQEAGDSNSTLHDYSDYAKKLGKNLL